VNAMTKSAPIDDELLTVAEVVDSGRCRLHAREGSRRWDTDNRPIYNSKRWRILRR